MFQTRMVGPEYFEYLEGSLLRHPLPWHTQIRHAQVIILAKNGVYITTANSHAEAVAFIADALVLASGVRSFAA